MKKLTTISIFILLTIFAVAQEAPKNANLIQIKTSNKIDDAFKNIVNYSMLTFLNYDVKYVNAFFLEKLIKPQKVRGNADKITSIVSNREI